MVDCIPVEVEHRPAVGKLLGVEGHTAGWDKPAGGKVVEGKAGVEAVGGIQDNLQGLDLL